MAYVMTPGREFGIPSEHYAEIIREGYRSAGFDVGILEDAIQREMCIRDRDTTTRANVTGAFYAAQGAINLTRSVVQAITVK